MSESILTSLLALLLISAVLVPYVRIVRKREREARDRFQRADIAGLQAAQTVHPHIDLLRCIGCGGCVSACPEGDVLAVIDGKATLVHGAKCVGHGLCAEACPVGGITLLAASPSQSAELPLLNDKLETTVENLYIAGELGGTGLIRNAIAQGKAVIQEIARRQLPAPEGGYDVVIVGAGPAGLAAGLAARERGLRAVVIEQDDIGGTILQYPRRKIVMTSPVELPLWGRLNFTEMSKEELLELWNAILRKTHLEVRVRERVTDIARGPACFTLTTVCGSYRAASVVLALGRRGTPRKLGVPGEKQSKVMYRLMDAESYRGLHVLVVGGGDSAVEAAVGLSLQPGNVIMLSYRREDFNRIKQRNREHLEAAVKRNAVHLAMPSQVVEILPESVVLETPGGRTQLPNHVVFIFAGGELPFELLHKTGVEFQRKVVTSPA